MPGWCVGTACAPGHARHPLTLPCHAQHKACASACHTVVDAGGAAFFCAPCFHGREGSATAAPLKCCDEDADDADNDSPFCVHFLPPFVSTARAFGGCAHRCFPEHDFDSYSSLMHQAKRVLQARSPELVARSLGFLPDEVDSVFKTVCVLTPAHAVDKVLAAMVLCGDAHKSAAQVLVAATHPEARQGGCMRALLLAASRHVAKASGIQALCLATARTDTRAATVWQRLGFRPVPSWPPGFVHRATSNDLGQVFVFSIGAGPAPVAPTLRLVAAPPASATVSAGAPPDWPGEVPFTSGAVPADAHPATMPKVHQPKVAIRRIDAEGHPCRGQWGLFARTPLQPCDCLLPYGGILRAACPSLSMHVVSAGGGLDVDAEHAGNEARYINHYAGIAELPNCRLEVRLDNTTGQRWLAVRLLHAVPAGRELVLDYGPQYAEKLRTPPAWLGRRGRDTKRVARAHGV